MYHTSSKVMLIECDSFQTKHEAEIEELRKAGHDAVAIIVEEYKVGSSV